MSRNRTWREKARAILQAQAKAYLEGGGDPTGLEGYLRANYPWPPRTNHPYTVWCQELRRFLHARTNPPRQIDNREAILLQAWNTGRPIQSNTEIRDLHALNGGRS